MIWSGNLSRGQLQGTTGRVYWVDRKAGSGWISVLYRCHGERRAGLKFAYLQALRTDGLHDSPLEGAGFDFESRLQKSGVPTRITTSQSADAPPPAGVTPIPESDPRFESVSLHRRVERTLA